jgi:hypothetical protein
VASLTDTEVAALREQALVIVREYAEDKTRNDGTVRWNDTSAIMAEEQLQLIECIEAEKSRADHLDRLRRVNGDLRLERTRELNSTEDELGRVKIERDANMESREKMAEALRQCIVERDQLRADLAGKRAAEKPAFQDEPQSAISRSRVVGLVEPVAVDAANLAKLVNRLAQLMTLVLHGDAWDECHRVKNDLTLLESRLDKMFDAEPGHG